MLISRFKTGLIVAIALCVNATSVFAVIVNPPMAITHTVTIQPIIVSDTGGGNTAEFFGTPSQQSSIEGLIDMVWAQAGIDVNFLASNSWNNTFANSGTPGSNDPRPTSDLNDVVNNATTAGVTHADPNVINMFFVNIAAGFGPLSENTAAGLAFTPGNGITQYVGSNLLTFPAGLDVIAGVVAHEIGHNFGLEHLFTDAQNLMETSASSNQGELLNQDQINDALASNFSVPVPVPAAVWLFATGLIGLAGTQRWKKA